MPSRRQLCRERAIPSQRDWRDKQAAIATLDTAGLPWLAGGLPRTTADALGIRLVRTLRVDIALSQGDIASLKQERILLSIATDSGYPAVRGRVIG